MRAATAQIVAAIDGWTARRSAPLVVAIDGHGGAGKTTIASEVSIVVDGMLVHTDEYFHDARDDGDPRPMARYYAWQALREQALEPSIAWLRGRPLGGPGVPVILVEGVSSASPALADLVSRAVFVDTPEPLRLQRLHARVSDEAWDEEWLEAERRYFASRPPESFDLIVSGVADSGSEP